jgi:ATP-dependent protease ClpP protease subunit
MFGNHSKSQVQTFTSPTAGRRSERPQEANVFIKPYVTVYEFYLSGEIGPAQDYVAWFDLIRNATENEAVKIYINSEGGSVFTAIQFLRVLQETSATVIVSVEGACMSAATMVFLAAETFEVSNHSMFMFHNYSGGTVGKGGEMYEQIMHERLWSKGLLEEIYKDFLNPKEIDELLNNRDIWMSGDQVLERLRLKQKRVQTEQKRSAKMKDIGEDAVAKKPARRNKPKPIVEDSANTVVITETFEVAAE